MGLDDEVKKESKELVPKEKIKIEESIKYYIKQAEELIKKSTPTYLESKKFYDSLKIPFDI